MKNQNSYKRGFTLIELLGVVLIIGILASVALPQYQKAVKKARLAEVWTTLSDMEKAYDLCMLENSDDFMCIGFQNLSLTFIDDNGASVTTGHFNKKGFNYFFSGSDEIMAMDNINNAGVFSLRHGKKRCYDFTEGFCKQYGFTKSTDDCPYGGSCYVE